MSMIKGQLRKRLDGARTKPLSKNLEENIMNWINFRWSIGLRIEKASYKKNTIGIQEIGPIEGRAEIVELKASRVWLEKFICRNNLPLRR